MATFALHRLPVLATLLLAGCATAPQQQPVPTPQPETPPPAEAPAEAPRAETPAVVDGPPPVEREFRGVWVAAVANIDWPSRPGLPVDSQKAELIRMLDRTRELGMNAFILHVRPAADALYASQLEPWSEFLTGEQGKAPEPFYDPLEFAVREAHARGLELHAWFNPYRAHHPAARSPLAPNHIARARPDLVKRYGSYLWMDPGEDEVRQRTIDVIVDVVRRYDVDGVHIDDYFYPYRERGPDGRELDFPDSASYAKYLAKGGTLNRSDWRRDNVNRLIKEMYAAVKKEKPWVKVGISPIGTWRPGVTPQTRGFDAYESIYADSRKWFMEGDLDYFVPQLYWPISRTDVSFAIMLNWWAEQNVKQRALYAGQIIGRFDHDEVIGQIYVSRAHPGAHGQVFFSMRSLMPNSARPMMGLDTLPRARRDSILAARARAQASRDSISLRMQREAYAFPALVPAMPWLDDAPPPSPSAVLSRSGSTTSVSITPGQGEAAFLWVVQSKWPSGQWHTQIEPAGKTQVTVTSPNASAGAPAEVWVSAVDRVGNQSTPVKAQ